MKKTLKERKGNYFKELSRLSMSRIAYALRSKFCFNFFLQFIFHYKEHFRERGSRDESA